MDVSASPSNRFPKKHRLLRRKDFLRIGGPKSHRVVGNALVIHLVKARRGFRLGVTVTKRYGKAHDRNRFKRRVREAFRLLRSSLPQPPFDLLVKPGPHAREASFQTLSDEIAAAVSVATQSELPNSSS